MSAEPGWYADPGGSGQWRFYDGTEWGELAPVAPPPDAKPRAGRRLVLALIAALTLMAMCVALYECLTHPSVSGVPSVLLCGWGTWVILKVLLRLYRGDTLLIARVQERPGENRA